MQRSEALAWSERRQIDFDARMALHRLEGATAHRAGLGRGDCPYVSPEDAQMRTAWIGGMAEAALGFGEASAMAADDLDPEDAGIRDEGARAFADGGSHGDCPYGAVTAPRERRAWFAGLALAGLASVSAPEGAASP
jgi:ribosome modulation factor